MQITKGFSLRTDSWLLPVFACVFSLIFFVLVNKSFMPTLRDLVVLACISLAFGVFAKRKIDSIYNALGFLAPSILWGGLIGLSQMGTGFGAVWLMISMISIFATSVFWGLIGFLVRNGMDSPTKR